MISELDPVVPGFWERDDQLYQFISSLASKVCQDCLHSPLSTRFWFVLVIHSCLRILRAQSWQLCKNPKSRNLIIWRMYIRMPGAKLEFWPRRTCWQTCRVNVVNHSGNLGSMAWLARLNVGPVEISRAPSVVFAAFMWVAIKQWNLSSATRTNKDDDDDWF
jgi:hypothetical protein